MKKKWLVKTIALNIVVLFVSVSFQPVFAVDIKQTNERLNESPLCNDETVEYVIQIFKTQKIIEYTIYLSQKQANDLEKFIDGLHSQLDTFKSTEKTIEVFYDAVDSFHDLGIFPDNISINEIKQLITGENRDLDKIRFKSETDDGFENRLCLVACNTSVTLSLGPIVLLNILAAIPVAAYVAFLNKLEYNFNLSKFKILKMLFLIPYYLLYIPFLSLTICSYLSVSNKQPISIGSLITFGYCQHGLDPWSYDEYYPSNGWIFTLGLNGKKNYTGDFYGRLLTLYAIFWDFYNGITGFTGISIRKPDNSVFRLGFALRVNVGSNYGCD